MASNRSIWLLRNKLLHQLFDHGPYSEALTIQHASKIIKRTYTSEINSSSERSQLKDDKEVFGTLSESGRKLLAIKAVEHLTPDTDDYDQEKVDLTPKKNIFYYRTEIPKHARMGALGLKHALELYHQMKSKDRIAPFDGVMIPLIEGCAKAGYTLKAFEIYEEWLRYEKKPTPAMITMLVFSCGKCPFSDYGLKRLDWFISSIKTNHHRLKFNQIHYHAMIEAYGLLGRIDKAVDILAEMVDNDYLPNTTTINVLLMGCASQKEIGCSLALRLFKRMKYYGLDPNEETYELLARCIRDCELGPPQVIEQTISELPALSTLDDRLRHQEFISKITKTEQHVRDKLAWQPSISEIVESFKKLLDDIKKSSGSDQTSQLREKASGVPATVSNSQAVLIEQGDGNQTNSLIIKSDLPLLSSSQKDPNLLTDDPLVLISRIQKINLNIIRNPVGRLSLFGGLHGFHESMAKDGCRPTCSTFILLLPCLKRDEATQLEFLRLARDYEIKMDTPFYNKLIENICSNFQDLGRRQFALRIIDQMSGQYLRPTVSTYEALALSCDKWNQAERLINDITNCGYVIGHSLIRKLFRCAIHHQNFFYLHRLIRLSKQYNFKPTKHLVEKLEEIRLTANELLFRSERRQPTGTQSIDQGYLKQAKKFSQMSSQWLRSVEVMGSLHPWTQFETKSGSRRDKFQKFEENFRTLLKLKSESIERGKPFGILAKAMSS